MNEKINDFRDRLLAAAKQLSDVESVAPITDEVGVFAVECTDGTELFVEITVG